MSIFRFETLWKSDMIFVAVYRLSFHKNYFILETLSESVALPKFFYIILHIPRCFGQETAKKPFGFQVKLPPVHLFIHKRWRLHTVLINAERKAGKQK